MVNLRPPDSQRLVLAVHDHGDGILVARVDASGGSSAPVAHALPPLDALLRSARQSEQLAEVGRELFGALFAGGLVAPLTSLAGEAAASSQRLVLELRFDTGAAHAARLPWELLHDSTRFLVPAGMSLTRTLPYPEPVRPLPARVGPLEVLMIAPQPHDARPLNPVYDALSDALGDAASLDLAYLLPATWEALLDWLMAGPPGILHFDGRAMPGSMGHLVFEHGAGGSDRVEAAALANLLHCTGLPLMVLSATADDAGEESLLSATAPALIRAGVPAVLTMQQHLPRDASVAFMRAFYRGLLDGAPLEQAVAEGRRRLARTPYWHVPALYRRTRAEMATTQEHLAWCLHTAAPTGGRPGFPLRAALWLRPPDSPPPGSDVVTRVVGVAPNAEPAAARLAAGPYHLASGPLHVRLEAPCCEIHGPSQHVVWLAPGFEPPPVWFAVTPQQHSPPVLTFSLWQAGVRVGAATHTLRAAHPPADAASTPAVDEPVGGAALARRAGVRQQDGASTALVPVIRPSPLGDAAVSAALDAALSWTRRAPSARDDAALQPDRSAALAPREGGGWRRWLLLIALVIALASTVTALLMLAP